MTNRSTTLILTAILGGIIFGASYTQIWKRLVRPMTATHLKSSLVLERLRAQGVNEDLWERVEANLRIRVRHPKTVRIGDSFIIYATVEITEPKVYSVTVGLNGGERALDLPHEELYRRAATMFTSGVAGVEMALAGAAVTPEGPQSISNTGTVAWSVNAEDAGSLKGFVYGKWLREPTPGREKWRGDFDDRVFFSIVATKNFFTFENIMTWAARFLGPLLTLPGILAFIRARREKTMRLRGQKPRIILPGNKP